MIGAQPGVWLFKPQGIPARELAEVYLCLEGFEAIRLTDMEGLNQDEAAARMAVSRQTFGRVLASARRAVAEAIVNGLALRIDGGNYRLAMEAHSHGDPLQAVNPLALPSRGAQDVEGNQSMPKIAVSSEGPNLDSRVDPRFGRAGGFVVVDSQTMAFEYLDNGASQAMGQGAGIQTAELMAKHGVTVVLTGYVGPKAFYALDAAGIQVGQNLENLTVGQAVEKFKKGEVAMAEAPNKMGGPR
jgi:predicted DNA-binding protein (UPF0251 family)/predicted Fe-Mo cluster-binding NifX family protein